ncbi:general odorant-binding protein 28a-like [Lucilia sericata]|uniref:general odorant-binding protein 28a-like n=1 Tax=Lucilia sericata TaxID=13632 RepID=UPI0018A84228|nr:general odorant-binding protein 28a-like [Lucilia sericata]
MTKLFVTLAILCAFGAVVVSGFDKAEAMIKFMTNLEECKEEVGAQDSDFEEMVAKKPASTMEGKCLRSCIMKKCGVMDGNGKFDKDAAIAKAEQMTDGAEDKMKIAHEIIDACSGIEVSDDECEAAEQYGECFQKEIEAHGIKDEDFMH